MSVAMVLVIIFLSLFMNWFVQLGYYIYRKQRDTDAFKGEKTLLQYYTGFIGDGIIVPVINVLVYYIIVSISQRTGQDMFAVIGGFAGLTLAFGVGLGIDVMAHYAQGKLGLTNWSMPRPFHWNFPGWWHMISFPVQMAYLFLFFRVVFTRPRSVFAAPGPAAATLGILTLMISFVVLYKADEQRFRLPRN
ncbi:hypothetical protein M1555_01740 [Patescibacteria group bacterium]|nr:hypothetical protein [Patescibacteria group bacterium]